jgi:hypothetical protein
VQNTGSIPIKLDAIEFTNVTDPGNAVTISRSDGCWADGLQLHAGETTASVSGECKVSLVVNQTAEEGQTGANAYSFVGTFFADQWNEYNAGN